MNASVWALYGVKLAIVGALLASLYALGSLLRRGLPGGLRRRAARVVEARMLSTQPAIYIVRAGKRRLLLGAGSAGVRLLAELEEDETETRA